MATAPPVSTPTAAEPCRRRPSQAPKRMVATTANTTSAPVRQPVASTCASVMRAPSSATPVRSTVRAARAMPSFVAGVSARKFSAMPNSSA